MSLNPKYIQFKGVECICQAYDPGDGDCLFEFLKPRIKTEFIDDDDDGEIYETNAYDDITEHIKYSHVDCIDFNNLFINYSKTIEELILIFYNSIQDYYDNLTFYQCIYPRFYNYSNVDTPSCLYYSTEYDDHWDSDFDEYEEFADEIQNDRTMFFKTYNTMCKLNGVFEKFYKKGNNQILMY